MSLDRVVRAVVDHTPDARLLEASDAPASLKLGRVLVDVVAYPYPLLEPALPGPHGFPVAGLMDLAAMKLSAISRRGIRRDFWREKDSAHLQGPGPRARTDVLRGTR